PILPSLSLPSYTRYVKKSRRGEAESALMDIAQREQQYLLDARAYAPNLATLSTSVSTDVTSYYTIQICQTTTPCAAPGGTPPTFAVIATPIAGTAQAGDYTLTLDNTGAKGPPGAWRLRLGSAPLTAYRTLRPGARLCAHGRRRGFTVTELVVTLAVAAVLAT